MSLVFPNALAAKTTNLALARGSLWFGLISLAAVFASITAIQFGYATVRALPALLALVLIAASGVVVSRPIGRRIPVIVAAAVVAGLSIALFAAVVVPNLRASDSSDMVFLSLPKIAIIVFGVVVGRHHPGVAPVVAAAFLAELPVVAVSVVAGHGYAFDVPAFCCLAVLVLIISLLTVSRRLTRASEPALSQAGREDRAAAEQARAEHVSSAMVHDTILSELAVVGAIAPGPLSDRARDQIRSSLVRRRSGSVRSVSETAVKLAGDLATAVDQARADGLEVTVAGEVGAVHSLHPSVSAALGLAVLQCLNNVAAHSGASSAELTVIATDTEVCIMVIDSGIGFVESEMDADRLGVRHSVRGRIASVGGSVQVWTSPGAGTAVSMLVPRG